MRLKYILPLILCLVGLNSCKKDTINQPTPQPISPGSPPPMQPSGPGNPHELTISFKALVNKQTMIPSTKYYTNPSLDSFTITKLNYYISNIKLIREDGFVYNEPESYHLIKHVQNQTSFTIKGIPEGKYNYIEYLIGVDSLRNVSGSQTGALDVANDMFWEWNSGYIFLKMEGSYKTSKLAEFGEYAIHIGGFQGPLSCLQKCKFDLSTPVISSKDKKTALYYNTVVDEIFINPNYIDFDFYYANINNTTFKRISDNYKDMLVVDKVEN